jgi:hypothetical protein
MNGDRYSLVSIETGFGLGDRRLIPAKEKKFSLYQRVQTASGDSPASCQIVAGVSFTRREAAGAWSYIFNPLTSLRWGA